MDFANHDLLGESNYVRLYLTFQLPIAKWLAVEAVGLEAEVYYICMVMPFVIMRSFNWQLLFLYLYYPYQ